MNNIATCQTCIYFNFTHPTLKQPYGECRRRAPVAINTSNFDYSGYYPIVSPNDWCGEFTKKINPEDLLNIEHEGD